MSNELKEAFKKLKTVSEKFDFWEQNFKDKYIYFLIAFSNSSSINSRSDTSYSEYADYRIYPYSNDEILAFNSRVLNDYYDFVERFRVKKTIYSLEELKNNFLNDFDSVIDKKAFVDAEIQNTLNKVQKESTTPIFRHNTSHTFYEGSFKACYYNKTQLDLSGTALHDIENLIAAVNGSIMAEYLIFLNLEKEKLATVKERKLEPLSIEEQMLALDYLSMLNKVNQIKVDTNKAQLIALIIGKDKQNVRKLLSNIHSLKSSKVPSEQKRIKSRLQKLSNLFESVGLKSIQKIVDDDIKKLEQ